MLEVIDFCPRCAKNITPIQRTNSEYTNLFASITMHDWGPAVAAHYAPSPNSIPATEVAMSVERLDTNLDLHKSNDFTVEDIPLY